MSKYVTHKNGLILGSDNWFFLDSDDGEFRGDYRAIVWAKRYTFDQYNHLNCYIVTPAEQLIYSKYEDEDFITYYKINEWVVRWLNANVGPHMDKWDARLKEEKQKQDICIFFKRRSDGLKFIRYVNSLLKGMKIAK